MDAYIYIRFSTPKQEDGSSYERQLAACRDFVRRKGWREVDVIEDLGKSAWKGDHLSKGGLGKFAKRVFNHEIPADSVIVAENLDRFSRQIARVTLRWIEDVCDTGLKIATVANDRVYDAQNLNDNIASILEVLLLAEGAYRYVENLKTRVKGSYVSRLSQARIDNTAIHTVGPAWLEAVGKRPNVEWHPITKRVAIIQEIFDLTAAGHAPWAIAKIFNARPDYQSFTGKAWERTAIVKIIRNRAVEGDYVVGEGKHQKPTGEVLVGYYGAPIVPLDVVAAARAMLDRRRRGKGRNSGAINNLFGQLIRCGCCGGRMMQSGYQSRYLVCYEANRNNGCDQKESFKYRPFERAALDSVLHLALDETFFRQAQRSNLVGLEIAQTQKAVSDSRADAETAYDLWARFKSPTAERRLLDAEARIEVLEAQLASLNQKLESAQGVATAQAHLARVHRVREGLNSADEEVRIPARLRVLEALQAVIDQVTCTVPAPELCEALKMQPDQRRKLFGVRLIGGVHTIIFDNEGQKILEMYPPTDHSADDWAVADITLNQRTQAYFRRRNREGVPPCGKGAAFDAPIKTGAAAMSA